jgi:5-methylcytosine-specific restriction endonuclease McrA
MPATARRPSLRQRFLLALETDREAVADDDGWETRCLHCRRRLRVRADGEALGNATLEHVVPQAWFGKRAATGLIAQVGGDPDDARNLAIACAGCNHGKGVRHDARGPGDERARAVIVALLERRRARWRAPEADGETDD